MSEYSFDTSLDYLVSQISGKKDVVQDSILSGKLDINEYKRLCGVLQGLAFAEELIKDLAHKLEEV